MHYITDLQFEIVVLLSREYIQCVGGYIVCIQWHFSLIEHLKPILQIVLKLFPQRVIHHPRRCEGYS